MTRFQVVADYLLKIPIYTTSCKFVKGTFINTQWQMKFYDFVCVFICVFKNFYASKFLNWTKKKWNFILPVTQSPVIACAQQQNKRRRTSEKSVREKRHIFKMKVTFCMKNFRRKEREGSNYYPYCCLQHRWLQHRWLQHHRCPPQILQYSKTSISRPFFPSKKLSSVLGECGLNFLVYNHTAKPCWSFKFSVTRTLRLLYSIL